ncbi:Uncharacterized conserved protein, contains ParB-like and HNH nuclease domains [Succinivibrio dextrinosolvens]|uniref:DUF262 domain-containing protein n=1 Tax=Succinivibrio dextrinosolvens TaxID=83771 RepID=UPI0008F2E73A|nr:DUF262 domain-containing protein [Succinivibrio dextrinosolvens]SFS92216.1 Uncharacterized conserved protein, contains ParB-like and HNH nuclease domains [Succinivibrio dextrinosolvens]
MTTNFKTENSTVRKFFANGLSYKIPRFQRDYSWEFEQWEDLWEDLTSCLEQSDASNEYRDNPESHYMGYIVLQSRDDKNFTVIDGQQRITTVSIIILAILKNLQLLVYKGIDAENNEKRIESIRQNYIGYMDPITLITESKLSLNRNNNDYFQNYMVPLKCPLPQRGFRASEHLLRHSFEFFEKRVEDYVKTSSNKDMGQTLAKLVEDICDILFFTVITVTDELNAYKVFETLNARGVRLSSTDLLKNYLFSVLDGNENSSSELSSLDERWEDMIRRLQSEKFPNFLRVYWNSKHKLTRHSELFKTIKQNITDKKSVFGLIYDMEADLENYLSLLSSEIAEDWCKEDRDNAVILKMFHVRQPMSVLLAAKRNFSSKDFTSLLEAIKVISLRYNVVGNYSPSELEKTYNEIAIRISNGDISKFSDTLQFLNNIYIDDKRFESDFSQKSLNTTDSRCKKIVRYILCLLEKQESGNDFDYESDSYNIEHILPQRAPDNWGNFSFNEMSAMLYRFGNMTLMKSTDNRDIGNASYSDKKELLRKSGFKITSVIPDDYQEWSPSSINSRQKKMAKCAKVIWKISQLSSKK